GRAHKSEYDQGKQLAAQLCLPGRHGCTQAALTGASVGRPLWALSKFLANVKPGWLGKRQKYCCGRLVVGVRSLQLPASTTSAQWEADVSSSAGRGVSAKVRSPTPPL